MKNLKPLLIPIGLILLVVGIFSFTNHQVIEEDKKCTIKIVKIVDGVETVTDSTFDCDEDMTWMSQLHGMGDEIHKMIKVISVDGDSNDIDIQLDFDIDVEDENGMKVIKMKGGEGEEVDMKFDIKVLEGEDGESGVMKMMINGEQMEMKFDEIHKHMDKLHEHLGDMHHKSGNVEVIIDTDEGGKEAHTVKIIKTVDDEGNVTVKKIVNGEEVELDNDQISETHKKHKVMFIGEDSGIEEDHNITIDLSVDGEDGKEMKKVVIITKMSGDEKSFKKSSKKLVADKKELSVKDLKFSPNPNDGKFDLNFELSKKQSVQIKIVDLQGKEVYNETVSDFNGKYSSNIDISENGEGVYILQILQGKKASTSKVVIK